MTKKDIKRQLRHAELVNAAFLSIFAFGLAYLGYHLYCENEEHISAILVLIAIVDFAFFKIIFDCIFKPLKIPENLMKDDEK